MSAVNPPRAYVDQTNIDDPMSGEVKSIHLHVHYGEKQARIEMPVGIARSEREPGTETYRRELQELIKALSDIAASPDGIMWPGPR